MSSLGSSQADRLSEDEADHPRRPWSTLRSALADAARSVGEAVSRTAASAQELLADKELRKKGVNLLLTEAQSRLHGIQRGIEKSAVVMGQRISQNRRQLQHVFSNIERQVSNYQREWQLQQSRSQLVDVQFGHHLLENVPQEFRSRLWFVLLENPHLAEPLRPLQCRSRAERNSTDGDHSTRDPSMGGAFGHPGAVSASVAGTNAAAHPHDGDELPCPAPESFHARQALKVDSELDNIFDADLLDSPASDPLGVLSSSATSHQAASHPSASQNLSPQPQQHTAVATGVTEDFPIIPDDEPVRAADASSSAHGEASPSPSSTPPPDAMTATALLSKPEELRTARGTSSSTAGNTPANHSPLQQSPLAAQVRMRQARSLDANAAMAAAMTRGFEAVDEWEMVPSDSVLYGISADQPSEAVQLIMKMVAEQESGISESAQSEPELAAQQGLLEAMLQVPWQAGQGLTQEYPEDCRFAMLNEMTAGQEEIDDIITRDITRTFPEHPLFGLEAGRQSLFRVLKAYSLHDLEVGYCQGMAFSAGILLMYMPEEQAFRVYCRLMDPEGSNLRRLYLPGLDALKAELARFEVLLSWQMPKLHAHLQEHGLPAVLYVSQWLMTVFATPLRPTFCARIVDILLQDGNDYVLQRTAMALMEQMHDSLLELDDFEPLITYIKVEPLQWNGTRLRRVLDRALDSPISDAELALAMEAVEAELASRTAPADTPVVEGPARTAEALGAPEALGLDSDMLLGLELANVHNDLGDGSAEPSLSEQPHGQVASHQ